jgi:hypothetical protein
MKKIFSPVFIWEWDDFGIMFRIYKNTGMGHCFMSIDIQIAWLNIWIQCFKLKCK